MQLPYDFFCPSIQSHLNERICTTCSIYFPSKKAVALHSKDVHKKKQDLKIVCSRVNPRKISCYRQSEALCIFKDANDTDITEWVDIESLDDNVRTSVIENQDLDTPTCPIISDLGSFLFSNEH